jgi:hypothetical protein
MELQVIQAKNVGRVRCDQNWASLVAIKISPLVGNEVVGKRRQLLAEVCAIGIADTLNESFPILIDVEQMCAVPRERLCFWRELVPKSHWL